MTFLPIVERELRVNARRRWSHLTRVLVAITLMLIWLALSLSAGTSGRAVQHARAAFMAMTVLGLGFTMIAGMFLTADCLSEERREGTLGLLFLTDLKGYDVVLGKLASTSLRAIYALLAGVPVLALSLLMGGTTAGEFWRMALVLGVTLFLSLSLGMGVSAFSREARDAVSRTLLGMLILAGLIPVFWLLRKSLSPGLPFDWLLWTSPAYAYRCALDSYYSSYQGAREFWLSLGVMAGLGVAFLVGAMVLLPRVWQERDRWGQSESTRDAKSVARFVSKRFCAGRRGLLDQNPFYWLATRDQHVGAGLRVALVLLLAAWLYFYFATFDSSTAKMRAGFTMIMFLGYGLHLFVKCCVAIAASRRLSEDRQSGALELLLVTPLDPRRIVAAQALAVRRSFAVPVIIIVMSNALVVWLVCGPNPVQMSPRELPLFLAVFLGGIVLLLLDVYALIRVAIWTGLTSPRHNRATFTALRRVMLLPWLAILFFVFLGMAGGIHGKDTVEVLISSWLIGGTLVSILSASWAVRNLSLEFRTAAAGDRAGSGTVKRISPA